MPAFKNPNDLAKSMITSNDDMYREQLKSLGIPESEHESYLQSIAKEERESADRERVRKSIDDWDAKNRLKPLKTTPEQLDKIRKAAIKEFGLTNNFNDAFYMLPNGNMLKGGEYGTRYYDHRDINSPYANNNIDLQEIDRGGNTTNMLDFMRGGHLRIIPENSSIDIMAKPTEQQMNQIYQLWKSGKLNNLQASDPNDKYGQQLGYLENIRNERQIADFINKHFGGN